jgi:pimeloyl-ACP methyl ester carboxylesterase
MLKKPLRFLQPTKLNPSYPLFIFLPGMDGTGQLLRSQLKRLGAIFDIRCLSLPPDDLSNWEGLVVETIKLIEIERQKDKNRPVYLCGESFGGCLVLKLATYAPNLFDRLILINPASSFRHQQWMHWGGLIIPWLPERFYELSTVGLLPFLVAPDRVSLPNRRALLEAMQSVTTESAGWRLSLLSQFRLEELPLDMLKQPVLIIAGGADRLLPSRNEAQRLAAYLPNAQTTLLPESGHACLLEAEVNLDKILQWHSFLDSPDACSLLPRA